MARRYLDEIVPVNSGIVGQYISPVGPFSEPMYAMVENDTVAATPTRTRSSRPKKKKSNKPKNDGIIRNHDSVWDYKIQDGKLLTRRKSSDGKWYDITSNDEARSRIESFTGRSIGGNSNNQATNRQRATSQSTQQPQTTQPSQPARQATNTQSTPATTTQPARQQPVARQDSTRRDTTRVQQPIQQRSLAETPATNVEPDWQNMTDAEVAAYFSGSPLAGVTKTAKGNHNKRNQILSQSDLDANGWHWSNGQMSFGDKDTDNFNLLNSARNKVEAGDNILLDSNGAVVPTSEVRRYINRGRIPLYISDYDAQFYQPQSENGTLRDVRRAQDIRRNQAFDKQRNAALATMFSLPALGIAGATAPIATTLALGGSELVGAGFEGAWKHATGNTWAESLGANDANSSFYADMLQPGRFIGGLLGGYAANATQPARQAAIDAISARLPKPNVKGARLSLAMNKALNNKKLNAQDKRILKESVPYLFEPIRKTPMSITYPLNYGNYNYINPALAETMTAGPYAIPNYTNGVPFGVPIPRNIWGEMKWLPGDPLNRGSRVPYLNVP